MSQNIITATLNYTGVMTLERRYVGDYGQRIVFDEEMPTSYEVDFSKSRTNGSSVTMIGDETGVEVPDQCFATDGDVFVFLYIVEDNGGRTRKVYRIPVTSRSDRTDEQPTPVQESAIDQAISALNTSVAKTAQDVISADQSAQSAGENADRAELARNAAEGYAQNASGSASAAATSASQASTSASSASQSASQSAQIKTDVEGMVSDARGYADSARQSATQASASEQGCARAVLDAASAAAIARTRADEASGYAQTASTKASEAATSANTASEKASEATTSAANAANSATAAQTAKTEADTAKTQAETAQTAAETAQGLAEDAQEAAETAAQSIEASAAQISTNTADISDLKRDLSEIQTATSADVGKALKAKTVTDGKVSEWEFGSAGSGLTQSQKLAILNCFAHVAWTDAQGQTYYDELEDVLFPPAELTNISAVYVNSNPVYTDTDIDTLKQYITVTAHYSDGTTSVVNAYTLSGTLTVGTSVLTVAYSEMTTAVSVTVTEKPKSDMTQWSDGVMYTDIEVVANSYYTGNGSIAGYNGWNRTGKIPCDGASSIVFEAYAESGQPVDKTYSWFFDQNKDPLQKFDANIPIGGGTVTVPSGAYYFGFSGNASIVAAVIDSGFTPYA